MRRDVAATLGAAFLWGSSFPAIAVGLHAIDPLWFAALRFLAGLIVLAALAACLGQLRVSPLWEPRIVALGLLTAASFVAQFEAQTLTTPGKTALLVNLSVFPIAALSWLLYRERFGGARVPALLLAIVGVVLVTTNGDPSSLGGGQLLGDALAFTAGLAWAGFAVGAKPAIERHGALSTIVPVFAVALCALVPMALLWGTLPPASPEVALSVAYVGVATTAGAFALWAYGMRTLTPTVSAIVLVVEIVVALSISVAMGLESPTAWGIVGAGLISVAVGLAARQAPPEKSENVR